MSSNDDSEASRSGLVFNLGTGAVPPDATLANAHANIDQFVAEVTEGMQVHKIWSQREPDLDANGRFGFTMFASVTEHGDPDVTLEVRMPGLPLEQVNFGAREGDNAFDFPRLYVNGSSWWWSYGVNRAREEIIEAVGEHAGVAIGLPPTRLEFGYDAGLPEDVTVAWGACTIVTQSGFVDIVHDRQGTFGGKAATRALLATLNENVNRRWIGAATALLAAGIMRTREAGEFILTRTDGVIVKANTKGSGGYLYVCAYPEVPEHGSIAWARAEIEGIKKSGRSTVTSPGFEAVHEVIQQIERPAFGDGELVLVERDGGRIYTGRYLREEINPDGRPNGIVLVDLDDDPAAVSKKATGHKLHVGLISLTPIRPTGVPGAEGQ